ncbi:MAG: HAMP domain-containing histidine kinase [Ekhidna sp.]|nr:HAMP domain-containing histidine kinase [Ekhidna sp.]
MKPLEESEITSEETIKRLEELVEVKNAEIERASLLRDTLIKIVSHDIRGPLGNLKSVITLTREGQVGIDQIKIFMETIDKGVDHAVRMLEELMEWGHAASQNKKVDQEEILLKDIIEPAIEYARSNIDEKNLEFNLEGDLDISCLFDRNAIKVVIRNLLSNSVKFTERKGRIAMKIQNRPDDILIQFIDTGIGISQEMKDNLFELKRDNKRPGTENEKSSGVGLFICKDLIEQNGGTISVEDNPEGKGTVFNLTLKYAN